MDFNETDIQLGSCVFEMVSWELQNMKSIDILLKNHRKVFVSTATTDYIR